MYNKISNRFIPAGAGNSKISNLAANPVTVYPRRCGEQPGLLLDAAYIGGLSPQVRGTAAPPAARTITTRFIPAGAGNS